MIKETIGAAVLGVALFGAPAAATAAEVSTAGTAVGQATLAAPQGDGWWGHHRHYHHRHHHHGYNHGYNHGWPSYSGNYSGNQYGGINFRID